MKPFSIGELKTLLGLFQSYTGWQVQEIVSSQDSICFELYKARSCYLFFSLKAACPLVLLDETKFSVSKKTTPMLLFLKKYLLGSKLKDVSLKEGRVLLFSFLGANNNLQLEVRLFPHGQNIIATNGDKVISWNKPKDLPEKSYDQEAVDIDPMLLMQDKIKEYKKSKVVSVQKKDKKRKTKAQIIEDLSQSLNETTRLLEYDKAIKDISEQKNKDQILSKYKMDDSLNWYEVLKILKDKKNKELSKKDNIKKRIKELKREEVREGAVKKPPSLEAHRYLLLEDGKRAVIGKSAKDNWQLLRKAKAWYLWIHIRDMPSAHIIVEKQKQQSLSQSELVEVGNWLIKNSSLAKKSLDGDAFDLQYSECRYIRIPKGAKSGTVNVLQEKVLRFHYKRD